MYEQIQLVHSLYSVDEKHLQYFKTLAQQYTFKEDIAPPLSLQPLDNFVVVFQIFCMFKEEEWKITFLLEKMMTYSCNYFCLGLLKSDAKIKHFIQGRKMTDEHFFILSYYLSYVTLNWVYELLMEKEDGIKEIQRNMKRDYFLFAQQKDLFNDPHHPFYENQKIVTHLLATDSAQTDRYSHYIDQALSLTRNYFSQYQLLF